MDVRRLVAVAAFAAALLPAAPVGAQSRITTSVDTTLVTVGDRMTMTVRVDHPAGSSVAWPDSVSLAPFEVLGAAASGPTETAGGLVSTATITLAAFELGELEIPSFDVVVTTADGSTETLSTDRYGVEVASVGQDESGDIREIRGPLYIPVGVVTVGVWLLAGVLLAVVAFWLWRRWRRREGEAAPAPTVPARPPHEVALEALEALEASPLLERGQVKEYHIEASEIVRTFVEAHFRVPSLEMTTWEVLDGLRRVGVGGAVLDGLKRFLERCDMVKFAKVRPGPDDSLETLRLGRRFVEASMPVPEEVA